MMPLTWSVAGPGSKSGLDTTRLGVRIAPLSVYDAQRFDACLPGGAYSIAAWSRDTAWHGIEGTFKVCPRGDLNADGIVNAVDVVLVVNLVYKGMR
jgi:hypothetical protein